MKRSPTLTVSLTMSLIVLAASCGVGPDDAPRDIEPGAVVDRAPTDQAQAATGTGRIFLTVPGVSGEPTRVRSVARDVPDDPQAVLQSLLAGPNTDEFTDQFRTSVPTGVTATSLRRRAGGVLEVDLTPAIREVSGEVLVLALAQIVFTLSGISGVRSVSLTVDGVPGQWPNGRGELVPGPLTVYDFPGLEASAQPAYPALPSGQLPAGQLPAGQLPAGQPVVSAP